MLSPPQRRLDVNGAEPSDVMEYWYRPNLLRSRAGSQSTAIFGTNGVNRTELAGTSVSVRVTKVIIGAYPVRGVAWTPVTVNGGES